MENPVEYICPCYLIGRINFVHSGMMDRAFSLGKKRDHYP